jgi:hypothetical protein
VASNVKEKPGWYDVFLHGSPSSAGSSDVPDHFSEKTQSEAASTNTRPISPEDLADLVRRQPDFDINEVKGIRLGSCETGQDDEGYAQRFARAIGLPVEAPTTEISPVRIDDPSVMRPFSPTTEPPPPPPPRPEVAPPAIVTLPTVEPVDPNARPGCTPPPPPIMVPPPGGWPQPVD